MSTRTFYIVLEQKFEWRDSEGLVLAPPEPIAAFPDERRAQRFCDRPRATLRSGYYYYFERPAPPAHVVAVEADLRIQRERRKKPSLYRSGLKKL